MKTHHYFSLLLSFFAFHYGAKSQNIGIGITAPSARLEISKPGGDTPTLRIRGSEFHSLFNQGPNEDTYIRGGQWYSKVILGHNWESKVGIGIIPDFPLSFYPEVGDKISLYGSSGPHYGFGLQPYLLQIHTDAPQADIAFGSGSSFSFAETMRIKGNGNLGIGTNDPQFKLDVADRMRIRSGGGFSSAGLYFNRNDNSQVGGFAGMQDDTHVGFWGNPVGWGFTMNTENGALKVNGNEGQPGQILQSNGGGTPATWSLKPFSFSVNGGHISLVGSDLCVNIPTIDGYGFTLGQASTISYQFTIPLYPDNGGLGGGSRGSVSIRLLSSGTTVSNSNCKFSIAAGESIHVTVVGFADLPAGSYTISAKVVRGGTGDGNTQSNLGFLGSSPGCNNMTMQTAQFIAQVFPK